MKLSEKLTQLSQDRFEFDAESDEMQDGFNRCIEHAEELEHKLEELQEKLKKS